MCVCVYTTYSFTCNFNFAFVCSLSWLWRSCFTTFAPLRLHKKCMCHCCHMEFTLIGQHRHTHNRPHPIRIRPCSSSFIHNSLSCTTYQFEYMRVCMCAACLCIGNSRICHCFCWHLESLAANRFGVILLTQHSARAKRSPPSTPPPTPHTPLPPLTAHSASHCKSPVYVAAVKFFALLK